MTVDTSTTCRTEDKMPVLTIVDYELGADLPLPVSDAPSPPCARNSHCHVPEEKFDYQARNRLIVVLVLCIAFMSIEAIGGLISNSTAVMVDAIHMGIDAASFVMSIAAMYLATRKPTKQLSFGYYRAEVLGALLSVLTLWLGTGILVYMAIGRVIDQSFDVKPKEMIVVATCGVIFNVIMFVVLHINSHHLPMSHHGHSHKATYEHLNESPCSHTHSASCLSIEIVPNHAHAHSHHSPAQASPSASSNINVRAAIIHVIGDFVQSVGVLCAAILIKLKPEYKLADPICTFVFSVLVLITTVTIMRDIILVLMEGVPSSVNYTSVVNDLLRLPNVRHAHSLHIWSLSTQKAALSVHVAIDATSDSMQVLSDAQEMLRRKHGISRSTIQVEVYDGEIMGSCHTCRGPAS